MTDLDRLEKLCTEATPEPWKYENNLENIVSQPCIIDFNNSIICNLLDFYGTHEVNGKFIATSRTALPELISEIRSLQSRLEVAEKHLEIISHCECEDCLCQNEAQQALAKLREGKEE